MDEEQKEESKPKRTTKTQPVLCMVKVIHIQGATALVEWGDAGRPQRGFVPRAKVEDNRVPESVLAKAAPYGVEWEKAELTTTPEALADALRNHGIWTLHDAMTQPNVVIAALQQAFRVDLGVLLALAREAEK